MPNTGTITGLTAATEYVIDTVHVDAWGNVSAVVSSDAFTTDAAASGPTHLGAQIQDASVGASGLYSFTESGLGAGKAILALHVGDTGTNSVTSVTIAGVTASTISGAE